MFCANCGKPLVPDVRFCPACGASVSGSGESAPQRPVVLQKERNDFGPFVERSMGMAEAVSRCFSQYATFHGRARRAEYWWFYLFYVICLFFTSVIDGAVFGESGVFTLLLILATFLPYLAVTMRRLHDLDKSGWWVLISLVPIVGAIVLIIWFATRGTIGPNRFGADPLAT